MKMKKSGGSACITKDDLKVPDDQSAAASTLKKDHFRIVVMGAAGVGKTCIISQFLYETFVSEYKETVEELHRGNYEINGQKLTLDILDTTGSFEFPAMRNLSIATGDAFVLVYSIQDESSFEEVKKLREQILEQRVNTECVPMVIVGNKSDIDPSDRLITKLTAETTVNIDWGNGYIEASAKENTNIVGIFKELLTQAKVSYDLSPAIRRRRRSLPHISSQKKHISKLGKSHSCTIS